MPGTVSTPGGALGSGAPVLGVQGCALGTELPVTAAAVSALCSVDSSRPVCYVIPLGAMTQAAGEGGGAEEGGGCSAGLLSRHGKVLLAS